MLLSPRVCGLNALWAILLWQTVATSQTLTDQTTSLQLNVEAIAQSICILTPAGGRELSRCEDVPAQLIEMADSRLTQGDDPTTQTVFIVTAELGGARLFGTIIGIQDEQAAPMTVENAQVAFDAYREALETSGQAQVRSGPDVLDTSLGPVSQFVIERWQDPGALNVAPSHQIVFQFFGPGWFYQADFRFGGASIESFLPLVEAVVTNLRVPEWTDGELAEDPRGTSLVLWAIVGAVFVCLIGLYVWLRLRK